MAKDENSMRETRKKNRQYVWITAPSVIQEFLYVLGVDHASKKEYRVDLGDLALSPWLSSLTRLSVGRFGVLVTHTGDRWLTAHFVCPSCDAGCPVTLAQSCDFGWTEVGHQPSTLDWPANIIHLPFGNSLSKGYVRRTIIWKHSERSSEPVSN